MKNFLAIAALVTALLALPTQTLANGAAFESTGSQYPSLVLKNQFGETSINSIVGGTSNQIDCNFIVDSTNGNGFGVRSLKGPGCAKVFMHTTQTPASGSPNPAAGYILVQLAQQYAGYIGGYSGFVSPVSGTPINISSGLTAHASYIITSVGTSTAANWQAIGLPLGVTPAVGVSFVATTASAGTGTGIVEAPAAVGSGVLYTDVLGDANLSASATTGANILLRVLGATSSSVTTLVATAPADGTVIGLRFVMLPLSSQLK
jgi:hypothetical protein